MKLTLDNYFKDPCPACLPYIEADDIACTHCHKKSAHDEYLQNLAKLHITLDPKRTYIIHEGKVREVPKFNIKKMSTITVVDVSIESLLEVTQ
jgi:hypothetical protein